MPQLSYSQNAIVAQAGMAYDAEASARDTISRIAAVNIPFGVLCEIIQSGTLIGQVQPVQDANLAGTVTVTNASASITFSTAQTLPQGQALVFSDQPGVVYYLAAAIAAGTAGTLTQTYSGTGGAGKLTRLAPYQPVLGGISLFDPLGVEQNYVTWSLPTVLSGTVSVTNGSASITFSVAQTLPAGAALVFSSQNGVQYFLAAAVNAGTAGTLTAVYGGATNGAATTTNIGPGSSTTGWKAGTPMPLMRRGRVWSQTDGTTFARGGPINVWHSSTGANPQGVFTSAATSLTAGAEVDVAPNCLLWNPDGQAQSVVDPFGQLQQIAVVEINLAHAA
jgi:hypothetical protein